MQDPSQRAVSLIYSSRPAAPIIGLFYNMIQLGFEGYRKIALHDAKNARLFATALEKSKCKRTLAEHLRTLIDSNAPSQTSRSSRSATTQRKRV
jgi:glutamate/tyrosine decarboxylase-like PLP-dependent enzyme